MKPFIEKDNLPQFNKSNDLEKNKLSFTQRVCYFLVRYFGIGTTPLAQRKNTKQNEPKIMYGNEVSDRWRKIQELIVEDERTKDTALRQKLSKELETFNKDIGYTISEYKTLVQLEKLAEATTDQDILQDYKLDKRTKKVIANQSEILLKNAEEQFQTKMSKIGNKSRQDKIDPCRCR